MFVIRLIIGLSVLPFAVPPYFALVTDSYGHN
jgi:hypothetical protein